MNNRNHAIVTRYLHNFNIQCILYTLLRVYVNNPFLKDVPHHFFNKSKLWNFFYEMTRWRFSCPNQFFRSMRYYPYYALISLIKSLKTDPSRGALNTCLLMIGIMSGGLILASITKEELNRKNASNSCSGRNTPELNPTDSLNLPGIWKCYRLKDNLLEIKYSL